VDPSGLEIVTLIAAVAEKVNDGWLDSSVVIANHLRSCGIRSLGALSSGPIGAFDALSVRDRAERRAHFAAALRTSACRAGDMNPSLA
jgi:hypothetical protein